MRAQHNQVSLLCAALIKQFFCRVAGNHDGLHGDLVADFAEPAPAVGFDLVEGAAGQNLGALLRPDDMLQNQARIVLRRQFRGKAGHQMLASCRLTAQRIVRVAKLR